MKRRVVKPARRRRFLRFVGNNGTIEVTYADDPCNQEPSVDSLGGKAHAL